jgi:HPt (histidine-containing phosphotransfer) domain-containing protein
MAVCRIAVLPERSLASATIATERLRRVVDLIAALERSVPPPSEGAVAAAPAAPAAVDRMVLAQLQADLGGDPAIVVELIDLFLENTLTLLAQIDRALAEGDAEEVQRAAHTLKSTSGSVGARPLAARCADLERLAQSQALEEGAEQVRQIEIAYAQVECALRELRLLKSAEGSLIPGGLDVR